MSAGNTCSAVPRCQLGNVYKIETCVLVNNLLYWPISRVSRVSYRKGDNESLNYVELHTSTDILVFQLLFTVVEIAGHTTNSNCNPLRTFRNWRRIRSTHALVRLLFRVGYSCVISGRKWSNPWSLLTHFIC